MNQQKSIDVQQAGTKADESVGFLQEPGQFIAGACGDGLRLEIIGELQAQIIAAVLIGRKGIAYGSAEKIVCEVEYPATIHQ